jgi:type IV pilus assembly protein PilY1
MKANVWQRAVHLCFKGGHGMKASRRLIIQITLSVALILLPAYSALWAAAMSDYCMVPPFIVTGVKPNVMIAMDFSGSMQFPAYIPCSFADYDGYVAVCGSLTSGADYDPAQTYYGLFDTEKYYQAGSSWFSVNDACTYTDKKGGTNCISGNLLNWVTATKIDVARKVITGGRTRTGASDELESEGARVTYTDNSLGCKFIITGNTTANRQIEIQNKSGTTCAIGTLVQSNVDVKAQNVSDIRGLVHDWYDTVHFEFLVFSTGSGAYSREGEVRSGKDGTMSSLIAAINNEMPYWGTPTGEALWENYDFFKQSNDHSYEANTSAIGAANGQKDPWYDGSGSGSPMACRKCFVLLLSDGAWNGSIDPMRPARTMRVSDLRSATALPGTQNVTTYAVYAFGDTAAGRQAMITTAMFGGFDFASSSDWPYPYTDYPSDSRTVTYPLSQCDPSGTWNRGCYEWDKHRTGLPYNYFEADDGDQLRIALTDALTDMLRRASSGTAASVLASSEGSGANLLQAVFYPKRLFDMNEIVWTGEMQNLWYYVDPYLQNSTIREDTTEDQELNISNDYIIEFYFDTGTGTVRAKRKSDPVTEVDTVRIEEIKNLWEAGGILWERTSARTILTTVDGSSFLTGGFSTSNAGTLKNYMQPSGSTDSERIANTEKVINYVHGVDQTGYRDRTVTMDTSSHVWKLGDIVNSTPRTQSVIPINSYHLQPPNGYSDDTYGSFVSATSYRSRGRAYVGGNDGMLHAFYAGILEQVQDPYIKGRLVEESGKQLGNEEWAFIPKNALPYLKYLADPAYCHLYYVDAPVFLVDASVGAKSAGDVSMSDKPADGSSWRTILIGASGLGGACRNMGTSCSDCIKTPIDGVGYSSYFAIDVTDQNNPELLWEFSNPALGLATSGPAIIRTGQTQKNGKWYVVVASGPTGPVDTGAHQFLGRSDQNLKLFVLDLKAGTLLRTIDTGIVKAFSGSLYNGTLDAERGSALSAGHYQDDVLYLGYAQCADSPCTGSSTWTKGGVLRLLTKENSDPTQWTLSNVIQNTGPVTAAVTKLQDRRQGKLWLYFGSGRFFYRMGTTLDDATGQRVLYGFKEPCYDTTNSMRTSCSDTVVVGSLDNRTTTPSSTPSTTGWYINLDTTGTAERVITDPLAVFSGTVFFTTFAPSSDACSMGGNTYIWAVKHDAGSAPVGLSGKALIQVSTGEIKELSLSTAFSDKDSRRSAAISGVPPKGQGLSVLISPRPSRKVLHIQEK